MDPEAPELADAFWAVARMLRGRSTVALAPWDVTPSQFRAVATLARHGEMRLSALAEHLRIARRSATEVVDDLEARGLAARTPDPADRRATLVGLTATGAELAQQVRQARRTVSESIFGGLGPQDREDLVRILRTLRESGAGDGDTPAEDAAAAPAGGPSVP